MDHLHRWWKIKDGDTEGVGADGAIGAPESLSAPLAPNWQINHVAVDVVDDPQDSDDFADAVAAAIARLEDGFDLPPECVCDLIGQVPGNPVSSPAETHTKFASRLSEPGFVKRIESGFKGVSGWATSEFICLDPDDVTIADPDCQVDNGSAFDDLFLAVLIWHEMQHYDQFGPSPGQGGVPDPVFPTLHHAVIYRCQFDILLWLFEGMEGDGWAREDLWNRMWATRTKFAFNYGEYRDKFESAGGTDVDLYQELGLMVPDGETGVQIDLPEMPEKDPSGVTGGGSNGG